LTKPLDSYSFLWQHFHFTLEMLMAFRKASTWGRKLKIIFGRPDNIDPRFRGYLERKWLSRSGDTSNTTPLFRFILVQTLATLLILFFTILFEHYLSGTQLALSALFILFSVINTGAMLEQRNWVFHLEFVKLSLAGLFVYTFYPHPAVAWTI